MCESNQLEVNKGKRTLSRPPNDGKLRHTWYQYFYNISEASIKKFLTVTTIKFTEVLLKKTVSETKIYKLRCSQSTISIIENFNEFKIFN